MRAWRMTGTGEPLVHQELPDPIAGDGEVVVTVKAAGLCHTDVGILHEPGWAERISFPRTLGHEIAGVVVATGPGVEEWSPGDRVAVCPDSRTRPGSGRDGGYGEQCVALADDLMRIPDEVPFELAAVATDAGMTAYHAVMTTGGVGPGHMVGIIGLGGLGQVGARIAVLAGATVHAAEPRESVWPVAERLGVTRVVSDASQLAGADLDVVVDFAGFGSTTAAALDAVRERGRVVQVGMGCPEATISTNTLIIKRLSLLASRGGTVADIAAVLELLASGQLAPEVERIRFDQIPDGLGRLARGEVGGRLVAVYP